MAGCGMWMVWDSAGVVVVMYGGGETGRRGALIRGAVCDFSSA